MAKLFVHGTVLLRFSIAHDVDNDSACIWRRKTFSRHADGKTLAKIDVRYKPNWLLKGDGLHSFGWKRHAKVTGGADPYQVSARVLLRIIRRGLDSNGSEIVKVEHVDPSVEIMARTLAETL